MYNIKTTVETTTVKYVIGPGGERMTYEEWLEMKKAKRN